MSRDAELERLLSTEGYDTVLLMLSDLCMDRAKLHATINTNAAKLWRRRSYELNKLAHEANPQVG